MGYTLIDKKWHKKDYIKIKVEALKTTSVPTDLVARLIKEVDEIKSNLSSLNYNLHSVQEILKKILQLSKDTSTKVGKLHLDVYRLKKEGVCTVNRLIKQVDSMNNGVNSCNNDLAISIQTSYTSLSKNIEHSYGSFSRNVLNTFRSPLTDVLSRLSFNFFCHVILGFILPEL